MIRVRNPQDLVAGLFLVLVAILAYAFADNLPIGRLVNMGPGYVPRVLSWALGIMGVIIAGQAFTVDGPGLEGWAWRPLAALTVSVLVFALLLERAGLVITIIATVVIARFAAPGTKPGSVLVLAGILAIGSLALFSYGLGLPLRAWPEFGG